MAYLYYKSTGIPDWVIYNIYDTEEDARIDGRKLWKHVDAIRIDVIKTVVEEIRNIV